MRRMPSPVHTATTAQRTGSFVGFSPRLPDGRLPDPTLLLDLLPQIGDSDLAGPARLHSGFDGGPDVVGVDVAVPHAVAADHDDGVPETGPQLTERRDRLIRRFEQVHDLVTEPGAVVTAATAGSERPGSRLGPPADGSGQAGKGRPSAT